MSEDRGDRAARRPRGRRPRRKVCQFCVDKVEHIDYKEIARLRRYINERQASAPALCSYQARACNSAAALHRGLSLTLICEAPLFG